MTRSWHQQPRRVMDTEKRTFCFAFPSHGYPKLAGWFPGKSENHMDYHWWKPLFRTSSEMSLIFNGCFVVIEDSHLSLFFSPHFISFPHLLLVSLYVVGQSHTLLVERVMFAQRLAQCLSNCFWYKSQSQVSKGNSHVFFSNLPSGKLT